MKLRRMQSSSFTAWWACNAGEVIGLDVVIVEGEVTLPEDGGRTNFSFRVTGLVAFLVAKTAAQVDQSVQRPRPQAHAVANARLIDHPSLPVYRHDVISRVPAAVTSPCTQKPRVRQ
jgi:hypothetical protein